MKIAILGSSRANGPLAAGLSQAGFMPYVLEDPYSVKALSGHIGAFHITVSGRCLEAGLILFTQEASYRKSLSHADIRSLQHTDPETLLKGGFDPYPIVFLLDDGQESPLSMTAAALEKALYLAERHRPVIFLSRFVRTAHFSLEQEYQKARHAGVTFIKYTRLEVQKGPMPDAIHVIVSDESGPIQICTRALIAADTQEAGPAIHHLASVLRLRQDRDGFIDGENPYRYPLETNRKGIYALPHHQEGLWTGADFTGISLVLSMLSKGLMTPAEEVHAQVDSDKCALCYTCFRLCPHSAMVLDPDKDAMMNIRDACYGCGLCASQCPGSALSMTERTETAFQRTNSLKLFCCDHSAGRSLSKVKARLGALYDSVETIPIPCGGDVRAETLLSALKGGSKVLVAVCMEDACRYYDGNRQALIQTEKVRALLASAGLNPERITAVLTAHAASNLVADAAYQTLTAETGDLMR